MICKCWDCFGLPKVELCLKHSMRLSTGSVCKSTPCVQFRFWIKWWQWSLGFLYKSCPQTYGILKQVVYPPCFSTSFSKCFGHVVTNHNWGLALACVSGATATANRLQTVDEIKQCSCFKLLNWQTVCLDVSPCPGCFLEVLLGAVEVGDCHCIFSWGHGVCGCFGLLRKDSKLSEKGVSEAPWNLGSNSFERWMHYIASKGAQWNVYQACFKTCFCLRVSVPIWFHV